MHDIMHDRMHNATSVKHKDFNVVSILKTKMKKTTARLPILLSAMIIILMVLTGCNVAEKRKNLNNFSLEFVSLKQRFDNQIKIEKSRGRIAELRKNKIKDLKQLLLKYDAITSGDQADLLKANLLMEIEDYETAEEKLDTLLKKETDLALALMGKVKILIYTGKIKEALALFKEKKLETALTRRGPDLYSAYLFFAIYSHDAAVVKEFAPKFLNSKFSPEDLKVFDFTSYIPNVYRDWASALKKSDPAAAKAMMKKGIAEAREGKIKSIMEAELKQMEFIGKSMIPLTAERWLNVSPPVTPNIKDKTVLVFFWAPWCESSRSMLPMLKELENKYKNKDLVILSTVRLYGKYADERVEKKALTKKEEIDLLNGFIETHNMTGAVAIDPEGANATTYNVTAFPTVVLVNKMGQIDYIQVGAGGSSFITTRLKELMEEK